MKKLLGVMLLIILIAGPARADYTTGLVGSWTFSQGSGSTVADSSNNGNTATLTNASWVTGVTGGASYALGFNGTSSYVQVPNSSTLEPAALTISAWVNFTSLVSNTTSGAPFDSQYIIFKQNSRTSAFEGYCLRQAGNKIAFTLSDVNGNQNTVYSQTNIVPGTWYHVVATFNQPTMDLYINGSLEGTTAHNYPLNYGTEPLYMGQNGTGWNAFFNGALANVRIYNNALTSSEIAQVYGATGVFLTTDNSSYATSPSTVTLTATTNPASGVSVSSVKFYNGTTLLNTETSASSSNTYMYSWSGVTTGVYTLTAVVTDSTGAQTTSMPVTIYVNTPELTYTVAGNSYSLASLTYKGQQFIYQPDGWSSTIFYSITFQSPQGVSTTYSGPSNQISLVGYDSGNTQASGSACSSLLPSGATINTTQNPVCFQNKLSTSTDGHSFILSELFTTYDPQTLKIDYYITNNDPSYTITSFNTEGSPSFTFPNLDTTGGAVSVQGSPVNFESGTWGSLAVYTDDYTKNASFGPSEPYGPQSTTMNAWGWTLTNSTNSSGDAVNLQADPIAPGQTYHYAIYMRFGSSVDSISSLASQANANFAQSYPYLINWPDRRPIARWFMTGSNDNTLTDPRAYFYQDPNGTPNVTTQAGLAQFDTDMLNWADTTINNMNSMNPKPQAVTVWDLEGQEFYQFFTYVGYPNKLHDLAPEMDAIADQIFAKFKAAGYQVGMTLRPNTFMTGSVLPSNCNVYSTSASYPNADEFISTSIAYPNRGFVCTAANTWTQQTSTQTTGGANPYYQTTTENDGVVLFSVAVSNGGSGYNVGDQLYIDNAANTANNYPLAIVTVSSINASGAIAGLRITDYGRGFSYPTGSYNLSYVSGSGSGSSATVNLTNNYPQITIANLPNLNPTVTSASSYPPLGYNVSILANLESKIAYAHNRWGARLFYTDSTSYYTGPFMNFQIFRQIQEDFPDCLINPENHANGDWSAAVPYGDPNEYGDTGVPYSVTPIWPQAFDAEEGFDQLENGTDPTTSPDYDAFLAGVEQGSIFYVDGWTTSDQNTQIDTLYATGYNALKASNFNFSNFSNALTFQSYPLTVCSGTTGSPVSTCSSSGTGTGAVNGTILVTSGATHNQALPVQEINCTSTNPVNCLGVFDAGTVVTLTAVPTTGSVFASWSGACSGSSATCTVTMSQAQSVTATFNTGSSPACQYGCVSGDASPSIYDAELSAEASVGSITLTPAQQIEDEVDNSGKLDIYDAYLIAEYSVGLITSFPVGS